MKYEIKPHMIEKKSMEIIESIMDDVDNFDEEQLAVVKRVIHTTADFEYSKLIEFNNDPILKMKEALKRGCKVYADTTMIKSGVNRLNLERLGVEVVNYVHDEDVIKEAKDRGLTRSIVALEKAFNDKEIEIYLIGNAPTALYRLLELSEEHGYPGVIIGVPIGFVGASESKEELTKHNIPYITINGRKGGSAVAAAILNAVMKILTKGYRCKTCEKSDNCKSGK